MRFLHTRWMRRTALLACLLQKEVRAAAPRLVIPMWTWSRWAIVAFTLRLSLSRLP